MRALRYNSVTRAMTDTPNSKYCPGQVWDYKARDNEPFSTLTILKVWTTPDPCDVVSIAIYGVDVTDLLGRLRGEFISHAPFTAEALDRSVTNLVRESGPVPEFEEEYAVWQKEGGLFWTETVAKAITDMEEAIRYGQPPPQ